MTLKEQAFDANKHEIVAKWPWYWFGQGMRLKVAGKTYRFAWIPGRATAAAWGRRQLMELVSTLAWARGPQLHPTRRGQGVEDLPEVLEFIRKL